MTGIIATLLGLPRWAQGLGALGLAVVAFLIWDHFDDRAAIRQDVQKREAAAQVRRDEAADQRVQDAATNAVSEKGLHDAIQPSDPRRSLACERLRRLGRSSPACGHEGGNGAEAAASR